MMQSVALEEDGLLVDSSLHLQTAGHARGLADTVVDATPEALASGTASGFQFSAVDGGALAHAVERALELHADTDRWQTLVRRVMHEDWSWDASARKYLHLYQRVQAAPPTPVRVP